MENHQDYDDREEYEFDIVWSHNKQKWTSLLPNGLYLINLKAQGLKELNEIVDIRRGNQKEFRYEIKRID